MAAKRKTINIYLIITLLLLFIFCWSGSDLQAENKINMNFKETDIGDVLRTIAEVTGVNLVTDNSVTGKITVHLKDITFSEALELVTRTNQLAYRWSRDSVVVASPQRIEEIYDNATTSIISVKYARVKDLRGIINGIYPQLNIQLDQQNNNLVIQGNEKDIEKAFELVKRLDLPPKVVTRSIEVSIDNPEKLQTLIKDFYPALKLGEVLINNQLFLQGSNEDIEGALELIKGFKKTPTERYIETRKIKNTDPTGVREHLLAFFPELLVQADEQNRQILMAGNREMLDRAGKLINKLDALLPREKVEIVKIRHAELPGIITRLTSIYPELGVEADEPNRQLILSGTPARLKEVTDLINKLDLPREEKTLEIVKLRYIKAEILAEKIKQIFPEINIQIAEDNNQLIVLGEKVELEKIRSFTNRLDIAPDERIVKTVKVQGEPGDIARLVQGIFSDIQVEMDEANRQLVLAGLAKEVNGTIDFISELDVPRQIITRNYQLENTDPDEIVKQLPRISTDLTTRMGEVAGEIAISGEKEDVDLAISLVEKIDRENKIVTKLVGINYLDPGEIEPIIRELYPELNLQINKTAREIIVTGKEEQVMTGVNFIKKLDTPSRQVIIEARFEEISRTELRNLGFYPDKLTEINFMKDSDNLFDGLKISWPEAIRALEESGQANTLANPRLMALNGQEANLLIGDRIPIVVEDIVEGKVARKIEYIEAGISLKFKPWVTDEGVINLEVNPRVSSIGEPIGSSLPPINTREVQTKIRLKDGETFAIGGLIQDDLIESVSRTPILSDIPVLGQLFKQRRVNNMKTELIIFITPHIVRDNTTGNSENSAQKNRKEIKGAERGERELSSIKERNRELVFQHSSGDIAAEEETEPDDLRRLPGKVLSEEETIQLMRKNNLLWKY